MNEPKVYRRNPSVISTELDGGAILLNLDSKNYYNLNETAFRIWQILEENRNTLDIGKQLAIEYEVDLETASASLNRIMEEFYREGLTLANK
jgi:hypothetical protein